MPDLEIRLCQYCMTPYLPPCVILTPALLPPHVILIPYLPSSVVLTPYLSPCVMLTPYLPCSVVLTPSTPCVVLTPYLPPRLPGHILRAAHGACDRVLHSVSLQSGPKASATLHGRYPRTPSACTAGKVSLMLLSFQRICWKTFVSL